MGDNDLSSLVFQHSSFRWFFKRFHIVFGRPYHFNLYFCGHFQLPLGFELVAKLWQARSICRSDSLLSSFLFISRAFWGRMWPCFWNFPAFVSFSRLKFTLPAPRIILSHSRSHFFPFYAPSVFPSRLPRLVFTIPPPIIRLSVRHFHSLSIYRYQVGKLHPPCLFIRCAILFMFNDVMTSYAFAHFFFQLQLHFTRVHFKGPSDLML